MSKTGAVKFFGVQGYGFIIQGDGGQDLFAHQKHVRFDQRLVAGDQVRFDEYWDDQKGKYCAVNVSGGTGGSHAVAHPQKKRSKKPSNGKGGKGKGGKGDKEKGDGGATPPPLTP